MVTGKGGALYRRFRHHISIAQRTPIAVLATSTLM